MVVLGSEAPILKELQQPSSRFPIRSQHACPLRRRVRPFHRPRPSRWPRPSRHRPRWSPRRGRRRRPPRPATSRSRTSRATAAREAERELILRMLTRTRWNRKEAAEILGISYKALLYKIKENGLDKAS